MATVVDNESKSWWSVRKDSNPLGTYNDGAFHLFLQEQPSMRSLFNHDVLPYFCMPMCGVYGTEDYHLTDPLVLLVLPSTPILHNISQFIENYLLHQILSEHVYSLSDNQFSVIVTIHSKPIFECSADPSVKQINMMYHTWAFKDTKIDEEGVNVTLEVGAFNCHGILETGQDIVEELNGLSINRMAPKIQSIHNGCCLSPHNAQVLLSESLNVHSFFSFAKHPSGRCVLSYHIVPSTEIAEKCLILAVCKAETLKDLLKELNILMSSELPNISVPLDVIVSLLNCLP